MNNDINGGVITPTKLNTLALAYIESLKIPQNDIAKISVESRCSYIRCFTAQLYACYHTELNELAFYQYFIARLGNDFPRLIELYSKSGGRDIWDDIKFRVKLDTQFLNTNIDLHNVQPKGKEVYYLSFNDLCNVRKLINAYVFAALSFEYNSTIDYEYDFFAKSLKDYYLLLAELKIQVKKQYIFPNNTIINTTNSL